ncbi:MAG TPA: hypothetical protein VI195_06855 [Steroidobacteraceae bacterium]
MHVLLRASDRNLIRVSVVLGQTAALVARDILRVRRKPARLLERVTWQW